MKKTEEQLKIKGDIIKKSIQIYMLDNIRVSYDDDGKEIVKPLVLNDIVKELKIGRKTLYRWMKTGRISPYYERKLLDMGILESIV